MRPPMKTPSSVKKAKYRAKLPDDVYFFDQEVNSLQRRIARDKKRSDLEPGVLEGLEEKLAALKAKNPRAPRARVGACAGGAPAAPCPPAEPASAAAAAPIDGPVAVDAATSDGSAAAAAAATSADRRVRV